MDIFVIGVTGFVGGHLARHLAAEGHTVTGLARTGAAAATLRAQGSLRSPPTWTRAARPPSRRPCARTRSSTPPGPPRTRRAPPSRT
ncbi:MULTISPECIES: NAD-dependent epimerase/dehydratase family protein [Streptomyces]|uniref:NAD-dependent epimerase/dehydratase family protein n=1 Tax=Streptomyces TaxID=1883 RepID=UPI0009CC405B|nr:MULTISPECIES: NAD-dependent epimerase/dehydratase family protein [unclassified Streptomyces]ONI51370.1 2-dehydropantoate 2-reductase [Streptomyces sp. IB2014 011-1]